MVRWIRVNERDWRLFHQTPEGIASRVPDVSILEFTRNVRCWVDCVLLHIIRDYTGWAWFAVKIAVAIPFMIAYLILVIGWEAVLK